MPDPAFLVIPWILLIGLDILTASAKASLESANANRLIADHPNPDVPTTRAIHLLGPTQLPRVRGSLALVHAIYLSIIVWISLLLFASWSQVEGLPLRIGLALLVLFLSLALLEWVAAERAARDPEKVTASLSGYIQAVVYILYPLTFPILAVFASKTSREMMMSPVTEDELKTMVDAGQQEGLIQSGERKMIYSIFQLGNTLAREIMIPRIDITAIDIQTPPVEAVGLLLKTGFSRVPVYEESIDNVLGVLYTKDLLKVWENGGKLTSLHSLLREAYFVPEAKKVIELLADMQERRVHIAVIVDEYGGVAGLVTLEDIVEEIVGEIHDEFDQSEELPYTKVSDEEYIFQGRIDLDDFNEVMGSLINSDDADTLGGYIYNQIGRVPGSGETLQMNNLLLTVEQVIGRRIRKVRARWLPEAEVGEKKDTTNGDH